MITTAIPLNTQERDLIEEQRKREQREQEEQQRENEKSSRVVAAQHRYDLVQYKVNTVATRLKHIEDAILELAQQQATIDNKKMELIKAMTRLRVELADLEPERQLRKSEFDSISKKHREERRLARKAKDDANAAAMAAWQKQLADKKRAEAEAAKKITEQWRTATA